VLIALLALAGGLLLARVAVDANASTPGPLNWSAPVAVDVQPPFAFADGLNSISCGSDSLCLGTSSNGELVSSSDPTSASASDWSSLPTSLLSSGATGYSLDDVSCTGTFCAVTGYNASGSSPDSVVLTSTDPTGGKSAWAQPALNDPEPLDGIQCPAPGECIAFDSGGAILADKANTWSQPSAPVGIDLTGLSCATDKLCVAVDFGGNAYTWTDPSKWTTAGGSAKAATGVNNLTSISCPSTTYCVAEATNGKMATTTDPGDGASATWTPTNQVFSPSLTGSISSPVKCHTKTGGVFCVLGGYSMHTAFTSIDGGKNFSGFDLGADAGDVTNVSCPSASLCLATTNGGQVSSTTDPVDGADAVWSSGVQAGKSNYNFVHFSRTSCPSAGVCVGGDTRGRIITTNAPTAGAGAWKASIVDSTNTIDPPVCPSPGLCVAADNVGNILSSTNPSDASKWSITAPQADPFGISELVCPSSGLCVGDDFNGSIMSSTNPGGSSWTVKPIPGGTGEPRYMNCPTASMCVAVSGAGDIVSSTNPSGGGSTWSVSAKAADTGFVEGLTCPATNLCVGYDSAGHIVSSTTPTGPTADWSVTPQPVDAFALGAISCPSTTLCLAYDFKGNIVSSLDPGAAHSTWTPTSAPVDTHQLQSLVCPSTSLCLATDNAGNAVETTTPSGDASAWTQVAVDPGHTLDSATCFSTQLCVLADDQGNVVPGAAQTPPPTTTTTTTTTPPPPTKSAKGKAAKAKLKGKKVSSKLGCTSAPGGECKLRAMLTIKEKLSAGKVTAVAAKAKPKEKKKPKQTPKTKVITLASHTVLLRVGQSKTIQLSLNSKGKSLLANFHTLPVLFTVTQLVSGQKPKVIHSQKLTIGSQPSPKKKKKKT
jgi:hypothetical protein